MKLSESSVPIWTNTPWISLRLHLYLDSLTICLKSLAKIRIPWFSENSQEALTEMLRTRYSKRCSNRTMLLNVTMLAPIIEFRNSYKIQSILPIRTSKTKPWRNRYLRPCGTIIKTKLRYWRTNRFSLMKYFQKSTLKRWRLTRTSPRTLNFSNFIVNSRHNTKI